MEWSGYLASASVGGGPCVLTRFRIHSVLSGNATWATKVFSTETLKIKEELGGIIF